MSTLNKKKITQAIHKKAYELGFHRVGITSSDPSQRFSYYQEWLKKGFLGGMHYLKNHEPKKEDPKHIFPEVQSIICCALSYKTSYENPLNVDKPIGIISNYAWGDDYHEIMNEKLKKLLDSIQTICPQVQGKVYVDTGPLLERSYAERAGIGWVGKNTCILDQEYGSYLFLGEILINVALMFDQPQTDHCGSCTRCLDACPTGALLKPYMLDATRCIAYLTIEKKGDLSLEEKDMINHHIFGCDICQQVCPWNHKALNPDLDCFKPRPGNFLPELKVLLEMAEDQFKKQFSKSPVKRAKYPGFKRNVKAVLAGVMDKAEMDKLLP